MSRGYERSRIEFERHTADHHLSILHDDGLYRRLFCHKPGTGIWSWEVVTWPGHLYVGGDVGEGYVFARTDDMLGFFRDGVALGINPHYWAQKLRGPDRGDAALEYSEERFQAHIREWARMRLEEEGWDEEMYPALLYDALDRELRVEPMWAWDRRLPASHDEARALLNEYGWLLGETWEWDLRDFHAGFQRACWAIVWAVREYRAATEEADADHRQPAGAAS